MGVAIDVVGAADGTSNSTLITSFNSTAITVGTGSNRALVCVVTVNVFSATQPTGLTAVWDSGSTNQSMSLIASGTDQNTNGNNNKVYIFGLRNPTSGNKTLAFSWTNSASI